MPSDLTPPRATSGGGGVETGMFVKDVRDFDDSGRALIPFNTSISLQQYPDLIGKVSGNEAIRTVEVASRTTWNNENVNSQNPLCKKFNNGAGVFGTYDRYGGVWTEDNGATWQTVQWASIPWSLNDVMPGAIAWSPISQEVVVLETETGYTNKLHTSTDNGQTWATVADATSGQYGSGNTKIRAAVTDYDNFGASLTPIYIAMHPEGASSGIAFGYCANRNSVPCAEVVAFTNSILNPATGNTNTAVFNPGNGESQFTNDASAIIDFARRQAIDVLYVKNKSIAYRNMAAGEGSNWDPNGFTACDYGAPKESGDNEKILGLVNTSFYSKLTLNTFSSTLTQSGGVIKPTATAFGGFTLAFDNGTEDVYADNYIYKSGRWVPFFAPTFTSMSAIPNLRVRCKALGASGGNFYFYDSSQGKVFKGKASDPIESLGYDIPVLQDSNPLVDKLVVGIPAF